MNDKIARPLIYEELGLNPIWKELIRKDAPVNMIAFYQELEHKQCPFLILAITDEADMAGKQKLFKNITNYLSSITDRKNDNFKILSAFDMSLIDLATNPHYILLIADELRCSEEGFGKRYHSSIIIRTKVTLDQMIKTPKKKAVLWEDIQLLFNELENK